MRPTHALVLLGCRLMLGLAILFPACRLLAAGTGLTAEYFTSSSFTGTKTTRIDPTVDFDWAAGSPGFGGLGTDNFSIRWTGQIEPRYSETHTFYVTADTGARLWINERLVAARTFAANTQVIAGQVKLTAGERVAIRLEFIETTGNARVRLEWSSPSQLREVVPQSQLYPAAMIYERGSILREHWADVPGSAVSNLTTLTNYPNNPDGREFFLSFECLQRNWATNLGVRASGYLVPPADGTYTFAVAAADTAELWVSTDTNPANKQRISTVTNATAFRDWFNQTNQVSAPRVLAGGQKYYVELLQKSAGGDAHWSVAWQLPGATNFAVITADSLVPAGLDRAVPAQTNFLNTLTRGHPRLFATPERFEWLKAQVATNPSGQPAVWYSSLYRSATNLFTNGPVTYALDVRGVLLDDVRSMLARIYQLAIAWRVTGDTNFPARAWMEVTNAGALTNWNPSHFLDVAEMSHTFGVAYDWMYDYWSATQRTYLRTNLETKGLLAGLNQYSNNAGWTQTTANNWNLVCNGGLSVGALALGTDSESLAEQVLSRAHSSLAPVLRHWSVDNGNWYEGPGYWDYSSDYYHRHLSALESALGSDFGLSKTNGLSEAGLFSIMLGSANHRVFNYADTGGTTPPNGPQMFYWARRYLRPEYAAYQRLRGGADALGALWFDTRGSDAGAEGYNPDHFFLGPTATTPYNPEHVGVLRSAWGDPGETWIAFKGGEAGASHGDLDAGTFVLEARGKRWAWDLGSDNYALRGYFDENPASATNRWDYYRMRAEGQNTLVIDPGNGPDTKLGPVAPMISFQSETNHGRSFAIYDLTPVMSNTVTRAWRGFQLLNDRKDVLVQDEIVTSSNAVAWWFMHVVTNSTQVEIDPDGSAATLKQGNDWLWLKILSGGGTFFLTNAAPLPSSPNPYGQNTNLGYGKLAIRLAGVTNSTLPVWMHPMAATESVPGSGAYPALVPLVDWTVANDDPPRAAASVLAGSEDRYLDVDLWNYVSDPETPLSGLTFAVLGANNGTAVLLADGHTVRFTPVSNYFGPASFTYSVKDQAPDPRLLFHYDFEPPYPASTNSVLDRSGNARDGTLDVYGGVFTMTNDVPGGLGAASTRSLALLENGSNVVRLTRLVTTNELNLSSDDWTFATWAKRFATTNDDFILHLGGSSGFGPDNSISFYFPSGSASLALRHYINTNTTDVATTLTGFPTNQWRHLALARAGTNLLIYIDGALVVSTNGFNLAINQSLPVQLGGHASTNFQNQRYLNGLLDDTALFAGALDAGEIAALAGGMPVAGLGGASASNTFALTIYPANDAPLAGASTAGLAQAQFLDLDLRTLVSDVETATSNLHFRVISAVNGGITLLPDGHTARFTPTNTFTGAASFTYSVTDAGVLPTPFLYYSFEPPDVTGDYQVTDNSGNSRHGTLTNFGIGTAGYTNDAPGQLAPESMSLLLYQSGTNGAGKVSRTITTNDFNPNDSSWTFSGWFNRASTVDDDFIFYLGAADGLGPQNEFHLQGQSGQPNLRLNHYYGTNATDVDITIVNGAPAGDWHHVAVVFNRTNTNSGEVTLYLDGAAAGAADGVTLGMPRPTSAVFGGHTTSGASSVAQRYFNGQLDDLVLFTNALSAADVALLAARSTGQFLARAATNTVTVLVTNSPPALGGISNRVVAAGQTLLFTNSASDLQVPPQTLAFTLLTPMTNATLATNTGVFQWRVPVGYANTTNTLRIRVADNGSPVLSATQSFLVTVLPFAQPQMSPAMLATNRLQLTVRGDAGPDYTVMASTNLSNWSALLVTNPVALPFNWIDTNASNFSRRFYRVVPGP